MERCDWISSYAPSLTRDRLQAQGSWPHADRTPAGRRNASDEFQVRANAFGLFVVWLVVVGAGYVALSRYSLASGEMVTAPEVRPAAFPSSDSARSRSEE